MMDMPLAVQDLTRLSVARISALHAALVVPCVLEAALSCASWMACRQDIRVWTAFGRWLRAFSDRSGHCFDPHFVHSEKYFCTLF